MRPALLAASLLVATPAVADTSALRCGDVFDSKSATLVGARTIVVADGRIREVLPGGTAVPGARDVVLAGHTCMPGWIDLHVHLSQESNPKSYEERFRLDDADFAFRSVGYADKTLRAGFTTVRDLGGEVAVKLRNAINQGYVTGPRIYAAGKSIATTGGHADPTNGFNARLSHLLGPPGPTEGVVNSPEEARQAVRQRYKDGVDLIKITATGGVLSYAKSGDAPQFMVDEIRAIVETAKDYGYAVAAHAHGKEGMRRAIEGGVTSIEHGTQMDDEIFALMKKHGTWYVPTITAGKFVAEKAKVPGTSPRSCVRRPSRSGRRSRRPSARRTARASRSRSAPTWEWARTATTPSSSGTWSRRACLRPPRCSLRRSTRPRCWARTILASCSRASARTWSRCAAIRSRISR